MSPPLLLAPTGRGKTEYVLNCIRKVQAAEPLAPVWAILPNRIQVRAFQRRLGAAGGALGVETGTFYRFYAELLARAGQPVARLPEAVLHRLLRHLVERLAQTGSLHHYAPLHNRHGFARLLHDLFQELKQARIHREAFQAAVATTPPRLAELATLYTAYQDWLIRSDWMDAEGQGWLAALALEGDPALATDLRLLVVDGFDEFNLTQLAVLALLSARSTEVVITLTGDPDCERIAHRRFCRARQAVEQALGLEPSLLPGSLGDSRPASLIHLEAALFEQDAVRMPAADAVTCLEAQTRNAEVRAALRWLKILLVREGYHLDQVALLARDLKPYCPHLAEVATEFGLPLYLAGGQALATNPAVAALLNLLALPVTNWPRRPLLDALSNPYLDWSEMEIGPEEVRGLTSAARAGLIIAGLDQWREALERLAGLAPRDQARADDADLAPPDVHAGEKARTLQACLEAVVARLNPPPNGTFRDYAAFVEDLIGEDPKLASRFGSSLPSAVETEEGLRIVARAWESIATAERDVAALRRFKDVLRGLVLAESVLLEPDKQPVPFEYARFYSELRGAVEAAVYEAPAPPASSAILAAPLLHARGLSFRAVALLGLSEGEFPRPESEDPLLTEADRQALYAVGLALEPRLQGDEGTLFYEAITRARERLLLCRTYLANDGQAWEPSPYWDEVLRLVEAPVFRLRAQDPLPLADAASLPEALLITARSRANLQFAPPGWDRVLAAAQVVHAREASEPSGRPSPAPSPWEGNLAILAPALAAHYSPDHIWSASRLEAYATCPFLFLIDSVLGLEPRLPPAEGYDIRILGTMYHAILEETYRRALPEAHPDRLRAILAEVAGEIFDAAPDQYGFRPTALWSRQQEELTRILAETLEGLIQTTAHWQPVALEQAFGIGGRPDLDVNRGGRRLRLRGFVDRLDRDEEGRLQIIDYKAGSTPISPRDLESGKRLQLPLYALAVRDALDLGEVGGGFYWHIGSAQPSRLRLEEYLGGVEFAIETALEHAMNIVEAVQAGQFPPRPPAGGCPDNCPASSFCWRYAMRAW
jgi:ATP-dependent helicase/nuclease subunit B